MTTPPQTAETAGGASEPEAGPLDQAQHRLSDLALERVPNAVLVAAPDGRIAVVNRQLERLFGYRPE